MIIVINRTFQRPLVILCLKVFVRDRGYKNKKPLKGASYFTKEINTGYEKNSVICR